MIFKIISNKIFDFLIMFCIIINIAAMASNYEGNLNIINNIGSSI